MRYLGGKSLYSNQIAKYINNYRVSQDYIEIFCGSLHVAQYVDDYSKYCYDIHRPLITMLKALQQGWNPPSIVTEGMYDHYKEFGRDDDPMTAFIGFGCSFGGRYYQGYARPEKLNRNRAAELRKSLLKKIKNCRNTTFKAIDYRELTPKNSVIYCDPPYKRTAQYIQEFNIEEFWEKIRDWVKDDNIVFAYEKVAPDDFIAIKTFYKYNSMNDTQTEEYLFVHEDQYWKVFDILP